MKTIQQIADELGTSKQNVYKRINKNGLTVESFTRIKEGRQVYFDDESTAQIMAMFKQGDLDESNESTVDESGDESKESPQETQKRPISKQKQVDELTGELEASRRRVDELVIELSEAKQEIERLRAIEERHLSQIDKLTESLNISQMLQAKREQILQALPEPQTSGKKGLFASIKRLFAGEKKEKAE